ncbi:MAG TPA: NAD-dependent epimerase/dehydratase family protein [Gemmatimonadaceae bacterium]
MATSSSPVLVTGAAGFVGFHLSQRLLRDGREVVGVDSLNDYYDRRLKEARLDELRSGSGFRFERLNLADREATARLFDEVRPGLVAHLAAQAGVRYSLEAPHAYTESNVVALGNVLESCRQHGVGHFTFASSSSVYGANTVLPFSEHHGADHPLSLYAATKRSGELMGYAYSHLFDLPFTALRFFTVYGPWGRPDMALFKFTKAILEGQPIEVFHHGESSRDYTYVDDVVEAFVRVLDRPPQSAPDATERLSDPATGTAPFRLYNVGHESPVRLSRMIEVLESCLGRTAQRKLMPPQPGDVAITSADGADLARDTGFRPRVTIEEGIPRFVEWYRAFYRV